MMNEMVDHVAKAIAESQPGRNWDTISEHGRDWWRAEARAALEAMREPTEKMKSEPTWYDGPHSQFSESDAYEVWTQMIDAALK